MEKIVETERQLSTEESVEEPTQTDSTEQPEELKTPDAFAFVDVDANDDDKDEDEEYKPAQANKNFGMLDRQELSFLNSPRLSYQIFLCKECRDKQKSCTSSTTQEGNNSTEPSIVFDNSGYGRITYVLCPFCIHSNLRIHHIYKTL